MAGLRMGNWLSALAIASAAISTSSLAEKPLDRPFSMRGVELGITIDEFREATIPNDGNRYDSLQTWCSNDARPRGVWIEGSNDYQAAGIVECQWFSTLKSLSFDSLSSHWIKLGDGSGRISTHWMPSARPVLPMS